MQSSNLKGAIAETQIVAAAVKLGIAVYSPVVEHGRSDMVFEIADRLYRVQCKWGAFDPQAGVVKVKLESQRCTPSGYVRRTYSLHEIDLVAIYCGELHQCFLLPVEKVADRRQIWLRLSPPGNAQRACINLAAEFEFSGAVAQLEERSAGSRKVGGSSPPSSTGESSIAHTATLGSHEFRNRFGYHLEQAAAGHSVVITRHGRPFAELRPPAEAGNEVAAMTRP